jgi:hypothetical protein
MSSTSARLITIVALLVTCAATVAAQSAANLTVIVSYNGKGKVDETHEILVFLFDHPVPTADSNPLAVQSVQKSGGTATFTSISSSPVYVVMVYDEKADYDGRSGPPPAGTPIGTYSKAGKPVPVTPGANVKVVVSFDDSKRWTP